FRLLHIDQAARVFKQLTPQTQIELVEMLEQKNARLIELFNTLPPDDRTAFFSELPGEVTQHLLTLLNPRERKEAIKLLGYPEDSIGRLMTTDYVAVRPHWTVEQALQHIRRFGKDSETVNII